MRSYAYHYIFIINNLVYESLSNMYKVVVHTWISQAMVPAHSHMAIPRKPLVEEPLPLCSWTIPFFRATTMLGRKCCSHFWLPGIPKAEHLAAGWSNYIFPTPICNFMHNTCQSLKPLFYSPAPTLVEACCISLLYRLTRSCYCQLFFWTINIIPSSESSRTHLFQTTEQAEQPRAWPCVHSFGWFHRIPYPTSRTSSYGQGYWKPP